MPIVTTHCHVLHGQVNRLSDMEGHIIQVFCPEYDATHDRCRIKLATMSGGPLSQLLERVSEETLDRRGCRCDLLQAV